MDVRDPIHGAVPVSPSELAVLDHEFVQRLRDIRQTGFSHLPFPGATHSRYAHCVGVMHLAGIAFDMAYREFPLSDAARSRFRGCVRLAALCHDLGHAPFSHCTEFAMPMLATMAPSWYGPMVEDRRATHEDYTIAILERSSLAETIARGFLCTARHVASLVSADVSVEDDFFSDGGLDHRRLLSQLISSELDVDRMDYLVRDSYFTGARYGQIDATWLLTSLMAHAHGDSVDLAFDARALYAFDDFLIARHHMFLMVYFHHKSVVYEEMLRRFVTSRDAGFQIPADLDAYLTMDDVCLEMVLRQAENPWARRIVERRPYRRVVEKHGNATEVDLELEKSRLFAAGVGAIHTASVGKLSRYANVGKKRSRAPTIWVIDRLPGLPAASVRTLFEASEVFRRYAEERHIGRLYAAPEDVDRVREVLGLVS
jgi:HD superfamily phosphohydrolase